MYILTKAAWSQKELKNQCYHFATGALIALCAGMIFTQSVAMLICPALFAAGMEIDQYWKDRTKIKLIDCIRDFMFYMAGAVAVWGMA